MFALGVIDVAVLVLAGWSWRVWRNHRVALEAEIASGLPAEELRCRYAPRDGLGHTRAERAIGLHRLGDPRLLRELERRMAIAVTVLAVAALALWGLVAVAG